MKIAKRKGVKIFQSVEYEEFYRILKRNLSKRHGVSPTHTLKELKRLRSLFPEQLKLFSAKLDNKMIAGVLNFLINERVVLAFYISHDEEYKDYRPLNFLFYKIFEWAIYSKYKIYDFGTFTLNQEPNMGLGRYKENFGASGVFRDSIEMKLLLIMSLKNLGRESLIYGFGHVMARFITFLLLPFIPMFLLLKNMERFLWLMRL